MASSAVLLRAVPRMHSISKNLAPTTSFFLDFPLFVTALSFHRRRLFSDSPEKVPDLRSETSKKPTESPPPIRIISYDVKPEEKVAVEASPPPVSPQFNPETKWDLAEEREIRGRSVSWTREDTRYIKNVPSISPVSYPMKTAPLPEDRDMVFDEEVGPTARSEYTSMEDEIRRRNMDAGARTIPEYTAVDEQGRRRTIDATRRVITRVSAAEEEEVPFPELIKLERKVTRKVVYDLQEAIREVKLTLEFEEEMDKKQTKGAGSKNRA